MGYDIRLADPATGETIHFDEPHHMGGGTRVFGGTTEAWLSVTYNYSNHFYRVMGDEGIRSIYGKTGEESVPLLNHAIAELGIDVSDDYWEPTEGNAAHALRNLRQMALKRPDGIWKGD